MAFDLIGKVVPPNTPVVLHSLSSAKFNGLTGRCGRYDIAKGRCSVTLTDTAREISVKPVNLRLLYPPGTRVQLHSLTASSALNGRVGRCVRFDPAKERFVVMIDGVTRKQVTVKTVNLRAAAPLAQPNKTKQPEARERLKSPKTKDSAHARPTASDDSPTVVKSEAKNKALTQSDAQTHPHPEVTIEKN